MKNPFYILLLSFCFIAFTSTDCKHNPVGPENIQPGRRDYTWTFDTLHLQLGFLRTIWGSSLTDVWAGGFDDLYHYDGTKWTHWAGYTGFSRSAIFGFNTNDVWLSGDGARLWHFDGSNWANNFTYKPGDSSEANIEDIRGTSSNNIYAVGWVDVFSGFANRDQVFFYV